MSATTTLPVSVLEPNDYNPNRMSLTRNGLEFLRDGRGIYGLDFRMKTSEQLTALIVRPDKFAENQRNRFSHSVLQPVPLKPRIFRYSTERKLADDLHKILFQQSARLDGMNPGRPGDMEADLRKDTRLRHKFYGTQAKAYGITNALIRQLLDEAGDQDAIRVARQYGSGHREDIYWLASKSRRLRQICDTFPIIARIAAQKDHYGDEAARTSAAEIIDAIERGKPLRSVAQLAGVPFVMRAVPPRAVVEAYSARSWFERNPHLINHMPKSARAIRTWFEILNHVGDISPDFAEWCSKRMPFDCSYEEAAHEVRNIGDWVTASYNVQADRAIQRTIEDLRDRVPPKYFERQPTAVRNGFELVRRPFSPDMSLATVRCLSEEWHDALAGRQYSPQNTPLPEPWSEAAEAEKHQFVPIETALELYHEGKAMRHCVTTYAERVRWGDCYIYSMRKDEKRIATVEVVADGPTGVQLGQVAGPCNQRVDRKTQRRVEKWFRSTKFTRPVPKKSKVCIGPDDRIYPFDLIAATRAGDFDAEIPF